MNNLHSSAILIDSCKPSIPVFAVSVTEVKGHGLVLRFAAELGTLSDVLNDVQIGIPVLVLKRGCRDEEHIVRVAVNGHSNICQVAGICGFPWMTFPALRRTWASSGWSCVVLSPSVTIRRTMTHTNINPATAQAAVDGISQWIGAKAGCYVTEHRTKQLTECALAWEFLPMSMEEIRWHPETLRAHIFPSIDPAPEDPEFEDLDLGDPDHGNCEYPCDTCRGAAGCSGMFDRNFNQRPARVRSDMLRRF